MLTGGKLGELKNTGASDAITLEMGKKGISEQAAGNYIAQHNGTAAGHKFVFQRHGKKR